MIRSRYDLTPAGVALVVAVWALVWLGVDLVLEVLRVLGLVRRKPVEPEH